MAGRVVRKIELIMVDFTDVPQGLRFCWASRKVQMEQISNRRRR